jgi:hypothetical protein
MKKTEASTPTTTVPPTPAGDELAALSPAELGTVTGAGYRLGTRRSRRGYGYGRGPN